MRCRFAHIAAGNTFTTAEIHPAVIEADLKEQLAPLRDFARYTIQNIMDEKLKLSGDPERMRKWRDLKARIEQFIEGERLIGGAS